MFRWLFWNLVVRNTMEHPDLTHSTLEPPDATKEDAIQRFETAREVAPWAPSDELELADEITITLDSGTGSSGESEEDPLLAAHGVVITPELRAMDAQKGPHPHGEAVPKHTCECCKCLCWPLLVPLRVLSVFFCGCCRHSKHPAWKEGFEAAVTMLWVMGNYVGRCFCLLRFLTGPPLAAIPLWLPTLPYSVGCAKNTAAPHGGEWFFMATGDATNSCVCDAWNHCLCCNRFPGDPQDLPLLGSPERVVLYFHGGAFCLCSSTTHRTLLMNVVKYTGATVLAPDY